MNINCFKSYYNVISVSVIFYQPTGVVETDVVRVVDIKLFTVH